MVRKHEHMLSLRIALRYFFARKSHNAVNVISLISVAGVAVATAAIVCVLSVFNGFTNLALSRTSRVDAPLKVVPSSGKVIDDASALCARLDSLPEVAVALPVVEETGLAVFDRRQRPVTFKGVPDGYDRVVDYAPVVIDGAWEADDAASRKALLSVGTAVSLQSRPGFHDWLRIYVPRRRGRINPSAPMSAFRVDSLIVSGVYQVEDQDADADHLLISLDAARSLLDYDTASTAIELAPADGVTPGEAMKAVECALGDGYKVLDRVMQQQEAFRMINIEKWVTFAMLAFILVIAAFNIITTLAMLIIEKERDIDILRALGATPGRISGIFTIEGALVTLAGGVAGIIIGVALSLTQEMTGFIKMGGDHAMMIIDAYPVKVYWTDSLAVMGLITVVAILTSAAARFMVPRPDVK